MGNYYPIEKDIILYTITIRSKLNLENGWSKRQSK